MQASPPTVVPTATVGTVATLMNSARTRHLPVVDPGNKLVGVITAHDLIAKHAQVHFPTYFSLLGYSFPIGSRHDERELEQALAVTAADLMSTELVTVEADTDMDTAATLMLERSVSCLPVLNQGAVVGMLDEFDVVRLLAVEEQESIGEGTSTSPEQ